MKSLLKSIVTVGIIVAVTWFAFPHVQKLINGSGRDRKNPAAAGETVADKPAEESGKPKAAEKPSSKPKTAPKPKKPAAKELSATEKAVLDLYPMPEIPPLAELTNNWSFIPERAFPRDLTIHTAVGFDLERDGNVIGQRSVPAGSVVRAKGIKGSLITISPQGSDLMIAQVEMEQTSLKESIQEGYDIFVVKTRERVMALRESERQRIARMSVADRARPVGWTDGSAALFEPMKVSLKRGDLEDWLYEDVKRWRWLGKETFEGSTYDAGIVVTEVETIFGVFSREIKALIRNGNVEKWVDPVSGQEY